MTSQGEPFKRNEPADPVTIALRIPGQWSHPGELVQRLPDGCRLTAEALIWPDTTQVAFGATAADDQYAQIFRSSCRQPAAEDELVTGDGYRVVEAGGFDIVEVIRYLSRGEKPVGDGHVIADLNGPPLQVFTQDSAEELAGSPMYNPFGRLRLVNMRDIPETN